MRRELSPPSAGDLDSECGVLDSPKTALRNTTPQDAAAWPYGIREYLLRALWVLVYVTVWKVCVRRVYVLRVLILKLFGADVSWRVGLSASTWIERPWDVSIGEYASLGPRTTIYNLGRVSIGPRTILSQDVYVCGGTHDYTRRDYPLLRQPVAIGKDVWVCAGAFLGPGITVGDGAVIGARAVVMKSIEPWTVAAGNPARSIKTRVMDDESLSNQTEQSQASEAGDVPVGH